MRPCAVEQSAEDNPILTDYTRWCVDLPAGEYLVWFHFAVGEDYSCPDSHYCFADLLREADVAQAVAWTRRGQVEPVVPYSCLTALEPFPSSESGVPEADSMAVLSQLLVPSPPPRPRHSATAKFRPRERRPPHPLAHPRSPGRLRCGSAARSSRTCITRGPSDRNERRVIHPSGHAHARSSARVRPRKLLPTLMSARMPRILHLRLLAS